MFDTVAFRGQGRSTANGVTSTQTGMEQILWPNFNGLEPGSPAPQPASGGPGTNSALVFLHTLTVSRIKQTLMHKTECPSEYVHMY
jgi:hypothetical protein